MRSIGQEIESFILLQNLKDRYACKKFDDSKQVSSSNIKTLVEAFNLTPLSYGLQPIELMIISDSKTKEILCDHSFNQEQVKTASHILLLCARNTIDESFVQEHNDLVHQEMVERNQSEDEVIQRLLKSLSYIDTNIWSEKQAYIILGNLINVLAQLNIDSCPMEGFKRPEVDTTLQLKDKDLRSVLMLPIGYAAKDHIKRPKTRKKSYTLVHHFNI
jgi:nitroreductase / dihydropteridine reductase